MKFLKSVAMPNDPKVKEVCTLTGQKIGWLKHERGEWHFQASSNSDARLEVELLDEIINLIVGESP